MILHNEGVAKKMLIYKFTHYSQFLVQCLQCEIKISLPSTCIEQNKNSSKDASEIYVTLFPKIMNTSCCSNNNSIPTSLSLNGSDLVLKKNLRCV